MFSRLLTPGVLKYSAAFLVWSRLKLEEIDKRTRKLLTMHNGLCPKTNVDWLHLPRSEGGRGLIGVQDTVETAILELTNYVRNSKKAFLIAARTRKIKTEKHQMSTKKGK